MPCLKRQKGEGPTPLFDKGAVTAIPRRIPRTLLDSLQKSPGFKSPSLRLWLGALGRAFFFSLRFSSLVCAGVQGVVTTILPAMPATGGSKLSGFGGFRRTAFVLHVACNIRRPESYVFAESRFCSMSRVIFAAPNLTFWPVRLG